MFFKRLLPVFRANTDPNAVGAAANNTPVPAQCDLFGNLYTIPVVSIGGTPSKVQATALGSEGPVDGATVNGLNVAGFVYGFNADSTRSNPGGQGQLENWRNNFNSTILASAVRSANNNSGDQINFNGKGLHLTFNITAVPGAQTVTLTLEGKDETSGQYYTILAGAAQAANGTFIMRVYPGLTAAANLTANDILPRLWRVSIAHSGAGNFTYSVGASIIL